MARIFSLLSSIVRHAVVWAVYRTLNKKFGAKFSRGMGIASLVLAAIADRRLNSVPAQPQTIRAKARR